MKMCPRGGGQNPGEDEDEVVDTSPVLRLKASTLPQVSFIAHDDVRASLDGGVRILDQDGQPVAKENLIVMQAGETATLYDEKGTGVWYFYKDGKLHAYVEPGTDGSPESAGIIVVKLKDSDQFACALRVANNDPYPHSGDADTLVNEANACVSNGKAARIMTIGEDLTIVPVESLDEKITDNADKALVKDTDYTVEYNAYDKERNWTTVTIDAKYAGQMLKCYSHGTVEGQEKHYSTVIFVDTSIADDDPSAGGGQTHEMSVTLGADDPAVVCIKAGDSVALKDQNGDALTIETVAYAGLGEATEGTDYTYNDGVFTPKGDNLRPGMYIWLSFVDGGREADAWIIYADDGKLTLSEDGDEAAVVAVNEALPVELEDGNAPASFKDVSYNHSGEALTAGTDYTYSNGELKILNAEYKGKVLAVETTDHKTGFVYVKEN